MIEGSLTFQLNVSTHADHIYSISLQVGKPCMIEQNDFITTAQDWYMLPCAVFGADALLSAFVTLRILSSEIVELVSPDRTSRHIQQGDNLMKLLNASLTRWEEHWHPIAEDGKLHELGLKPF